MAGESVGSIVVDTEISPEGFQRDSKKLSGAIGSLTNQIRRLGSDVSSALAKGTPAAMDSLRSKFAQSGAQIANMRQKLQEFADVRVHTDDYESLINELDKTDKEYEKLIDRKAKMDREGTDKNSAKYKRLQTEIQATRDRMQELVDKRNEMESSGDATFRVGDTEEFQRMSERVEAAGQKLEDFQRKASNGSILTGFKGLLAGIASTAWKAYVSLQKLTARAIVNGFKTLYSGAAKATKGLVALGSGAIKATRALLRLGSGAKKSNKSFKGGLMTILKYGFGIRSLYFLVNKLRRAIVDSFKNIVKFDGPTNKAISSIVTALGRLKNSFGAAFQPIVTAVAPYLTQFLNMLSDAMTKVGEFFAALTGQSYYLKAKTVQTDYAKSLEKTTKAAKEAKQQLAGFDELNILSDSSNNSSTDDATVQYERIPVVTAMADFFKDIKDAFENGNYEEIGRILSEKINEVFSRVDQLISWENIGNTLSRYVDAICSAINGLVYGVNWELIGRTFGSGINTVVNTLNRLLTGIDWEKIGSSIARGFNGLVKRVNWENLGAVFGNKLKAIFETLYGFARDFKWGDAGTAFANGVYGLIGTVSWSSLGRTLSFLLNGAITFMHNVASNFKWKETGERFAEAVNSIINEVSWFKLGATLRKLLEGAIAIMKTAVLSIEWGEAGTKFGEALNGFFEDETLWSDAGATIDGMLKGLIDFGQRALDVFKPVQVAVDLKALFKSVDWDDIAKSTWKLIKTAFQKAGSFLSALFGEDGDNPYGDSAVSAQAARYEQMLIRNFDPNKASLGARIGKKLADVLNAAIKLIPADQIGDALDEALNGVLDFAISLVKNFDADTFREKLEEALGRVDWDAIARKVWLFIKDGLAALAKSTPLIGDLITQWESELSASDTAERLRAALGDTMDQIAEFGNVKGGLIGENFFDGFRNKVLDESGHVKDEFRGRMGEMFSDSEIEAFERGDMTAVQFYNGLGFGGIDAQGNATESLLYILNGILDEPVAEAETGGARMADELFSSYIYRLFINQRDAEDVVDAVFNDVMSGIDANGYGDIIAFDYFNSFMKTVMDESGHVKPEFKDVVESMFGSVDVLEDGKVDANDFMRGLVQGMLESSGDTRVKLIDIVDNILEKVRTDPDGLDEHSPSRRAAKYGKAFLEGFSNGVDGEEKNTTSAVKNAFTSITDIAFAMLAMNLVVSAGMVTVKTTFEKKLAEIEASAKASFNTIKTNIDTSLQNINTSISSGVASIKNRVIEGFTIVKNSINESMRNACDTSMKSIATLIGGIDSGTSAIRSSTEATVNSIGHAIESGVFRIEQIVSNRFYSINNSIVSNLSSALNSAGNLGWYRIGEDIINGIARGLNNGWGWLQRTVWNLAVSLYNTARNALGIHSPSKMFRDGVGAMLGLGVAEGMEDSQPVILDAVSNVADAMAAEMNKADVIADLGTNGNSFVDGLDDVLSTFSDKVRDSFSGLLDKLSAIANSVTFGTPAIASGTVVPYSVSARAEGGTRDLAEIFEASNDDLASVVIQATNQAALAIVQAIEENGSRDRGGFDKRSLTDAVITEINRRTKANGASPLLI